jgi:hypothetical protein
MKEWAAVPALGTDQWEGLAAEAFEFVGQAGPSRRG